MTCRVMGSAIVCGPPPGVYRRAYMDCPVCERRHGCVIRWDGAWYGTTTYGLCGDRWMDGEMAPREWRRGWRKEAIERAREMWKHAAPRDLFDRYARADIRLACNDGDEREQIAELDAAHRAILARAS